MQISTKRPKYYVSPETNAVYAISGNNTATDGKVQIPWDVFTNGGRKNNEIDPC